MYFPLCVDISGKLKAVLHGIFYSTLDSFWCLRKDLKQAEPNGNSSILPRSRQNREANFTASFTLCHCSIRTITLIFVSEKQHSCVANPCMTRGPLPKLFPGEGSLHNWMQQAGHHWEWTSQCSLVSMSTGLGLGGVFQSYFGISHIFMHTSYLTVTCLPHWQDMHVCPQNSCYAKQSKIQKVLGKTPYFKSVFKLCLDLSWNFVGTTWFCL